MRPARSHRNDRGRGNTGSAWVQAGTATSNSRCPTARAVGRSLPGRNLSRVFWGRQGQLRIGGTGNWVGYPELEDLSTYDVTFSVDRQPPLVRQHDVEGQRKLQPGLQRFVLRPRRTGRAAASREDPHVGRSAWGDPEAGVPDLFRPRRTHLPHRVRSELHRRPSGLANGQSIRGTAGLERTLGQRDTMALVYSLESTLGRMLPDAADQEGSYYLSQYGSLQWTHLFSTRSAFLLEAGASYTPDTEAGWSRATSEFLRWGQLPPPGEELQRHAVRAP